MKDFSKATARPWIKGQLLMTRSVRSWTQESKDKQNAEERLRVFSNFTSEDEGRSRRLVATCSHPEDAELIVTAVNNFDKMKNFIEGIVNQIECQGREGCTYGDTEYDSISAAYGYNSCLSELRSDAVKLLESIK